MSSYKAFKYSFSSNTTSYTNDMPYGANLWACVMTFMPLGFYHLDLLS